MKINKKIELKKTWFKKLRIFKECILIKKSILNNIKKYKLMRRKYLKTKI